MNIIAQVDGFEELRGKIKALPDKLKTREVRKILRRSARPTVKAARDEAPPRRNNPRSTGNLKNSIRVAVMRKAAVPMVVVGPRSSGKYDGWYGRAFVIPGHNIYRAGFKRNRKGNTAFNATGSKSRVEANPFMDRAKAKTQSKVDKKALVGMEKYVKKQIDKL